MHGHALSDARWRNVLFSSFSLYMSMLSCARRGILNFVPGISDLRALHVARCGDFFFVDDRGALPPNFRAPTSTCEYVQLAPSGSDDIA